DAVPVDERAALRDRVPVVDADEHDALLAVLRVRLLQRGRLRLARHAVRLEEVDHDRLAAQRAQREPAVAAEAERGEARRRPADLRRMRLMRQLPDEQRQEPRDGGERDGLAGELERAHQAATIYTGVPTSTWSKSHSACATDMRMQPCE